MASTSETGNAKNVANFENLIAFCIAYGATYNPSKTNLQIAALQTQLASCQANISSVASTGVAYNNAVNARMQAFEGLNKLSTRLVNALDATDASKQTVKNAKSIIVKLQGRGGAKLTKADAGKVEPLNENDPVVDTPKTISTAQLSYTNKIESFSKLVETLSAEPTYLPNETDLQVVTLNAALTNLKNTNTGVINAYTTRSNARISRDQSLYNTTNGLTQVAKDVKLYVKSVFGATSPQYKQVNSISFKTREA